MLRMNVTPKELMADDEGFYRLFTSEKIISANGSYNKFKIKPGIGGNYLQFARRLDLFKFLVSGPGATIDHLQFHEKLIKNTVQAETEEPKESCSVQVKKYGEKLLNEYCPEMQEKNEKEVERILIEKSGTDAENVDLSNTWPDNSDKIDNVMEEQAGGSEQVKLVVGAQVKEYLDMNTVLAQKEEEIRNLKRTLMLKEEIIQKKVLEKIAANSRLKEAFSQLEKIHHLADTLPEKD